MPSPTGSLNVSEAAITTSVAITSHDTNTVTPAHQLLIICTIAGNVKVKLSSGSLLTFPVIVGMTILPWAVAQVFVTGTTATATYFNLS